MKGDETANRERSDSQGNAVPVAEQGAGQGAGQGVSLGELLIVMLVALVAAWLMPLDDADLPMHLLTGEWVLQHRAVPVVEPFAWTRPGAPFYAYSWLIEVLYALGWRLAGATGLSALHALVVAASALAVWAALRELAIPRWGMRLTLALHLIVWLFVQPATRPQLVLAVAVPLVWFAAARVSRTGGDAWSYIAAAGAGVLAVNTHLLFPLTAVPVATLLVAGGTLTRREFAGADEHEHREPTWSLHRGAAGLAVALVVGWMLTPYLPHLLDTLRLNFRPNALFGPRSPVEEHEPGVQFLLHAAPGTWVLVAVLAIGPFLPAFSRKPAAERVGYVLAWGAGAGLFTLAIRGLVLWWLLALPLVAQSLAAIPLPRERLTQRVVRVAWWIALLGLLGQPLRIRREHPPTVAGSPLPHPSAEELAPAVSRLTCLGARDAAAAPWRGVTGFDYGSYLAWRVPTVSWSIDGRTIFPDSVALPEARQEVRFGAALLPPFRTADVIVVTAGHALLDVLRRDSAFVQVSTPSARAREPIAQLWVRTSIAPRLTACGAR